ncbi:MAG: hydantoinase/oxoprolinase family protein [Pseudomonadota bacterium]
MIRAGSDIGGTFTDVIVFDAESSDIRIAKIPSSADLEQAVLDGIQATEVDERAIDVLVHGSTVVINALLERKGVKTALVTTAGFRDVYEIGRINRPDSFNVFFKKHDPLVARELRLEVDERMLPDGELRPLEKKSIDALVRQLREHEVEAIAILLLHAYANPAHELALKEALAQAFPNAFISISSELTREYREYERTSTVVANAYVGPIVEKYVGELATHLEQRGFDGSFYLMQSNGGLLDEVEARKNCIALIESGPAGGVIGTQQVLDDLGLPSGVAFDMGGTTAKAGVVEDGVARVGHQYFIGSYNTGLPVLTPVMDIHEVGTGGGSIATVTQYGELRVGPQSAGAIPGPACYQVGGTLPTVTDANVVLGRLNATLPLASAMRLDEAAAREALNKHVAEPLGVSVEEAAEGILRVANSSMAYAISAVTIERGLNPADFVLVAYGGAGPLHATQIARELAIKQVVLPPSPGVFSAYGMLFADPQAHASRTRITRVEAVALSELKPIVDALIADATAPLSANGSGADRTEFIADMRYVGQEHTVNVPLTEALIREAVADEIKARFDEVHERTYSHSAADEPAEIVTLRCVATVESDKPSFKALGALKQSAPSFEADVWLDEGAQSVPFYSRVALAVEQRIEGPAVIFEETASSLLLPGDSATVHANGHLLIEIEHEGGDLQ